MSAELEHAGKYYILIIQTDSYAGNFERELCGFLTGEVGECEVGDEEAAQFKKWAAENNKKDVFGFAVISKPDDHGCHRPAAIWDLSNTGGYNDVAIFFETEPTEEQLAVIRQRLAMWPERALTERAKVLGLNQPITFKGLHLIEREIVVQERGRQLAFP